MTHCQRAHSAAAPSQFNCVEPRLALTCEETDQPVRGEGERSLALTPNQEQREHEEEHVGKPHREPRRHAAAVGKVLAADEKHPIDEEEENAIAGGNADAGFAHPLAEHGAQQGEDNARGGNRKFLVDLDLKGVDVLEIIFGRIGALVLADALDELRGVQFAVAAPG